MRKEARPLEKLLLIQFSGQVIVMQYSVPSSIHILTFGCARPWLSELHAFSKTVHGDQGGAPFRNVETGVLL